MHAIEEVRRSTSWVVQEAQHVSIDHAAVDRVAREVGPSGLENILSPEAFDVDIHFLDKGPDTLQYLLVLDTINFCFWPDDDLEYEHLAEGLKAGLLADRSAINAERLAHITGQGVQELVGWHRPLPLQEERARLLREVGKGLQQSFDGQAVHLVTGANQSAAKLVDMLLANFPGFRDHCIYRGRQIPFLKRAQIFAADVWGAFQGQGWGEFHDIDRLTMFADYRVPVVLRELEILQYSDILSQLVDEKQEIPSGSEMECEIRACTIVAVELLKQALVSQQSCGADQCPNSVQVDWWLWTYGERHQQVIPHTTGP